MNTTYFQNLLKTDNNFVMKLYSDKITIGSYHTIGKSPYKYLNSRYKVDLNSGELVRHTYIDALRAQKSFKASLRRSLRTIYEISDKNIFRYFFTFTFNKVYVNRKNAEDCHRVYCNIIKRLKYTYGAMEFLTVPEFHKDESIHFHMMCNFLERLPKLRYRGKTPKGNPYYIILDSFKKEDCFITVEKLTTNNTDYLVKYFTKSGEFPLSRRFSCSQNLKRSRVVTSIKMYCDEFENVCDNALSLGFMIKYQDKYKCSLSLQGEHTAAPAAGGAAVDSFYKDITCENKIDISTVWAILTAKLRNSRGNWKKIYGIQRGEYKNRPRLHRTQLAFNLV